MECYEFDRKTRHKIYRHPRNPFAYRDQLNEIVDQQQYLEDQIQPQSFHYLKGPLRSRINRLEADPSKVYSPILTQNKSKTPSRPQTGQNSKVKIKIMNSNLFRLKIAYKTPEKSQYSSSPSLGIKSFVKSPLEIPQESPYFSKVNSSPQQNFLNLSTSAFRSGSYEQTTESFRGKLHESYRQKVTVQQYLGVPVKQHRSIHDRVDTMMKRIKQRINKNENKEINNFIQQNDSLSRLIIQNPKKTITKKNDSVQGSSKNQIQLFFGKIDKKTGPSVQNIRFESPLKEEVSQDKQDWALLIK